MQKEVLAMLVPHTDEFGWVMISRLPSEDREPTRADARQAEYLRDRALQVGIVEPDGCHDKADPDSSGADDSVAIEGDRWGHISLSLTDEASMFLIELKNAAK